MGKKTYYNSLHFLTICSKLMANNNMSQRVPQFVVKICIHFVYPQRSDSIDRLGDYPMDGLECLQRYYNKVNNQMK